MRHIKYINIDRLVDERLGHTGTSLWHYQRLSYLIPPASSSLAKAVNYVLANGVYMFYYTVLWFEIMCFFRTATFSKSQTYI